MEFIIENYYLIITAILGLCFGSFYNVVILRSLSNESIIFPPSKCPKCQNRLKPWHNIPVFSYIFLKGKCAYCKEKISIQYPIIEILTSILFCCCYIKYDLTWQCLFYIILCSCMLIMTTTDFKEKLVDCNIAIGLAVIAILYNWLINNSFLDSITGLVVGVLIMETIARIGYLFSKNRAFGEADTYIAGALGASFGLLGCLKILLYTIFASMIFIVPIFLYKQYKKNNKLICILFILFILTTLIFKTAIQNWYTYSAIVILGSALIYSLLKEIKNEASLTYLPLLPAFLLATLYFIFF